MAEVKWIKIVTDIFDDEKVLLIESCPDADAVIVIWFKLLCLAGKQNNSGVFMMNGRIPYTEEMLATIFRRPVNTVRMAISIFEQYGMIEIIDGVITIPKWDKHQTLDSYEKRKERDRLYQAERRANQRMIAEKLSDSLPTNRQTNDDTSVYSSTDESSNASTDESTDSSSDVGFSDKIRLDKIRLDKTTANTYSVGIQGEEAEAVVRTVKKKDVEAVVSAWNTHHLQPAVLGIPDSNSEEGAGLKEILCTYPLETVLHAVDQVRKSSFLTGGGERGWRASFKWFCNLENFRKVISGQYDNAKPSRRSQEGHADDDFDPSEIDRVKIGR